MKVAVFGGSGLVGDGFIQESLPAADVTEVVAEDLADVDACFWAPGVSAAGLSPQDYERITYGYTMAAAHTLAAAALHLARHGYTRHVLENRDIVTVAATSPSA